MLSSLEISLSQSLQNIVFKYLAAPLSLYGCLFLGSQLNSHYPPIQMEALSAIWLQEMALLADGTTRNGN